MVYDCAFRQDGEGLWTQRPYGLYVDALAAALERVTVFAPQAPPGPLLGHRMRASNVHFAPLPYYAHVVRSLPATLAVAFSLWRLRHEWDVLYLRVPCPLAAPSFLLARVLRRPVCLHVVGDLLEAMSSYPRPVRPLARLVAHALDRLNDLMAPYSLLIAQGDALMQRHGDRAALAANLIESTIGIEDIRDGALPPLAAPMRLLYVGALLEKKGLAFLIDAIARLRQKRDVRLEIVGEGPDAARLRVLARERGVEGAVELAGATHDDAELRAAYRRSDLFVLPSLAEGVPRVLLEAMAHGVPVVSTAVGGIPRLVRDRWNGVLVEPGSAAALCEGIEAVLDDEALRGRLFVNGAATARRWTREEHVAELRRLLERYIGARFPSAAIA